MVVTVSNWHFNRNTLKDEKAPLCKLENVMVTLKLSSTLFEAGGTSSSAAAAAAAAADDSLENMTPAVSSSPGAAANGEGGTVQSQSGESYFFDRNGAIIPYSAFVALLDSEDFQDYLKTVKQLYNGKKIETPVLVSLDDDHDDDDDDVGVRSKKRRNDAVKKMRYGKAKKTIAFVSDDEDDISVDPPRPSSADLGVTPLPSENEEESDKEDRNSKEADRKEDGKKEGGHKEERPEERKARNSSERKK
jgi:hypothetical protein